MRKLQQRMLLESFGRTSIHTKLRQNDRSKTPLFFSKVLNYSSRAIYQLSFLIAWQSVASSLSLLLHLSCHILLLSLIISCMEVHSVCQCMSQSPTPNPQPPPSQLKKKKSPAMPQCGTKSTRIGFTLPIPFLHLLPLPCSFLSSIYLECTLYKRSFCVEKSLNFHFLLLERIS